MTTLTVKLVEMERKDRTTQDLTQRSEEELVGEGEGRERSHRENTSSVGRQISQTEFSLTVVFHRWSQVEGRMYF
ncbi:hypothetical protein OJAV_G00020320 [Oryzias javanicus]|uniref:Uncharacterized protein n=1 Tax=Oryzias javanicus TaxID=123683 RepID=A0A437DHL2_ORYJA|nr:hypothetical protein OJAV_G00020320 [Oryzias javanicus]